MFRITRLDDPALLDLEDVLASLRMHREDIFFLTYRRQWFYSQNSLLGTRSIDRRVLTPRQANLFTKHPPFSKTLRAFTEIFPEADATIRSDHGKR